MVGGWRIDANGEFVLDEDLQEKVDEARYVATNAWTMALIEYLAVNTRYTAEELKGALLEWNRQAGDKVDIFETFVAQCLMGELNV